MSIFLLSLVSCSEENLQIEQMKISKARNQAEVLSYEALVINAPTSLAAAPSKTSGRGPASEIETNSTAQKISGTMGKDPWGQPFRYSRVSYISNEAAKNGEKAKTNVVVWSAGPNKQFEFNPEAPGQSLGDDIVVHQNHEAHQ